MTVKLTSDKDSMVVASDTKGGFSFGAVFPGTFKITVSGLGYEAMSRKYAMDDARTPPSGWIPSS
jgi:hypothetical protein